MAIRLSHFFTPICQKILWSWCLNYIQNSTTSQHLCNIIASCLDFCDNNKKSVLHKYFFVVNSYETPLKMHQCLHMNMVPSCDMNSKIYLRFWFLNDISIPIYDLKKNKYRVNTGERLGTALNYVLAFLHKGLKRSRKITCLLQQVIVVNEEFKPHY